MHSSEYVQSIVSQSPCGGGALSNPNSAELPHLSSPVILQAMPSTLVECVPNFSEGRDPAKVDAIIEAMKTPASISSTARWIPTTTARVITLVGEREAIQEAAIRGVGKAAELIDLTKHQGAHPRMGAADVMPFIPIDGALEDCVAMARHVGAEIQSAFRSRSIFTKPPPPRPSARTWKTSAAASSKASARKSRPIRRASLISANPRASHGRGNRGWRAQISHRL